MRVVFYPSKARRWTGVTSALLATMWWGAAGVMGAELSDLRARALSRIDAAVRGDRAALAAVRSDLATVLAAEPDDALARVHFGWALVLEARELPLAAARSRALAGVAEMDAAVVAAPRDPVVRLVRARSDSQMPRMLGREPMAEADFSWLVAEALSPAGVADWAPELRRTILFHAGAFALRQRRTGAVELLTAAAAIPAPQPSNEDLQSMLALARRELTSQSHAEAPHPRPE